MPTITLNNRSISAASGKTILEVARELGEAIPTLCHLANGPNHGSCFVCAVWDRTSERLLPSCVTPIEDEMAIETNSAEVRSARKAALELLVSEHLGDCESPCYRSCPAHLDIPHVLRRIIQADRRHAAQILRDTLVFPGTLGYICPAPCEKACRLKDYGDSLNIRLIHRWLGENAKEEPTDMELPAETGHRVAVVGSGPAGLSVAYHLRRQGHHCIIFEESQRPGGGLAQALDEKEISPSVLQQEIQYLRDIGIAIQTGVRIGSDIRLSQLLTDYNAVVLAHGERKLTEPIDPELQTSAKNVFPCGGAVRGRHVAVRSIAEGNVVAQAVDAYLKGEAPRSSAQAFDSRLPKIDGEDGPFAIDSMGTARVINPEALLSEEAYALISEEAARCLHCDCLKKSDCRLRQYAQDYEVDQRRFKGLNQHGEIAGRKELGDVVEEPGKCIKCGICVRISEMKGLRFGRAFLDRGFNLRVGIPLNDSYDQSSAEVLKLCAQLCPTGALAWREGNNG